MQQRVFIILLLFLYASCKKSDQFYQQLNTIPQINNTAQYRYLPAYGVGDTLFIVGLLHPENNLQITVGDINSPVVKLDSVPFVDPLTNTLSNLNRAGVIITDKMGIGLNRSVAVTSGGYTIQGAAIQIYDVGGEGSVSRPLELSIVTGFSSRQNIYLSCVNGKGDVYYYNFLNNELDHIKKDGTQETLLTSAQLNSTFIISSFIAGGVNPQGTKAWFSVQTNAGFSFCEADLNTKTVKVLNSGSNVNVAAPYEGNIGHINAPVSGVFPDDNGQVYVYIGAGAPASYNVTADAKAMAVARYNSVDGSLTYIFKTKAALPDMPGIALDLSGYLDISLKVNPPENTLYVTSNKGVTYNSEQVYVPGVDEYQLTTGAKISSFIPQNINLQPPVYLGPMTYLVMSFNGFGMMPLPHRRMMFIFDINSYKPVNTNPQQKSLVVDFAHADVYQWAPGFMDVGDHFITTGSTGRLDQLLNYDEDGQLYMTVDSRASLAKTVFQ